MNNTKAQLIIRNINEINDEINSFKKTMDSETLFKAPLLQMGGDYSLIYYV